MSTSHVTKIVDGPNRDYLFDALKYVQDKDVQMPVEFTVYRDSNLRGSLAPKTTVSVHLLKLGHEDGSGHSLLFEGFISGVHVDGWYHTKHRHGSYRAKKS
jgi:hypothetical protein